jgi:hypothetical protein
MEMFNEDSDDDLIPESNSNELSDNERADNWYCRLGYAQNTAKLLSASSTIYSKRRPEYRHSEHWCYVSCEFIYYI